MKYKKGDWVVFIKPIFRFCVGNVRKIDKIFYDTGGAGVSFYHQYGLCTFYNHEDFRKATRDEIIMEML